MKILVTGGAGFIGSNFIRDVLRGRPENLIINLDKLTPAANLENLAEIESNSRYQFHKGDICEQGDVASVIDGVDAVIHCAAESHVDRSIADAKSFVETNVQETYNLLDMSRRYKVGRVVHVSTDEGYGSIEPGQSASESSMIAPNSPYAASKAAADLLARSFWQTYHFPVIITRASNNYGPCQFPEKLIPLMITNALEGKRLPVYGDGLNERDWIYVEDHSRALDRVLDGGRAGGTYNIGGAEPVSNLAVVRQILQILGKAEDLIEFVPDRPSHDRRYALDSAKIQRELGWKPQTTLAEGLSRTVEWYRAHPDWILKTKSGEYREYYEKYYTHRAKWLAEI